MEAKIDARLGGFIAQLGTNPEYGYTIRRLLEPLADAVFATADGNFPAAESPGPSPNGHENGPRKIPAGSEIPPKVTATLASEVGRILLGEKGWIGPLSVDYLRTCEFNW